MSKILDDLNLWYVVYKIKVLIVDNDDNELVI